MLLNKINSSEQMRNILNYKTNKNQRPKLKFITTKKTEVEAFYRAKRVRLLALIQYTYL